jgi:hypothetical protein
MKASRIQAAIAVLALGFGGAGVGKAQSVPAQKREEAQSKVVVQVTGRVTENVVEKLAAEVPWEGSAG